MVYIIINLKKEHTHEHIQSIINHLLRMYYTSNTFLKAMLKHTHTMRKPALIKLFLKMVNKKKMSKDSFCQLNY